MTWRTTTMPKRRRRLTLRGGAGERGAVETTALLVLFPLMMLFLLLGVQATLVARANQVLKFAAQEGARAARQDGGGPEVGLEKANQLLTELDPSIFAVKPVPRYLDGGNDTAGIEVTATVVAVVPGFSFDVKQVSVGKIERCRRPGE
jgi:hypothetical protein